MYQRLSRKYQIKTPWWIYVGAALDQLSLSKTVNDAGRGGLPLTLNTWGVVLTSRVSSGCPRILLTSGLVKASYVGLAIAFVGTGQKCEDGRERQWGGSRGAIVGPFLWTGGWTTQKGVAFRVTGLLLGMATVCHGCPIPRPGSGGGETISDETSGNRARKAVESKAMMPRVRIT